MLGHLASDSEIDYGSGYVVEFGVFHILEVVALEPFGAVLGDDEIVLPRRHVPKDCVVGDRIEIFAHVNADGRAVATTTKPCAVLGEFAYLKVVDRFEHGAFLDWGMEKDLFVPNREQVQPMVVGNSYVVFLMLDAQNRMMASARVNQLLEHAGGHLEDGEAVNILVYEEHDLGVKVVVNDRYAGMVYRDEIYRSLVPGTKMKGVVVRTREDGKIDVRIRESGVAGLSEGRDTVLNGLRAAGGSLPLHDKSTPSEIRDALGMSKKAFKRAVGMLLKTGLLELGSCEIRLAEANRDSEEKTDPGAT